jgi:hypothetical protein
MMMQCTHTFSVFNKLNTKQDAGGDKHSSLVHNKNTKGWRNTAFMQLFSEMIGRIERFNQRNPKPGKKSVEGRKFGVGPEGKTLFSTLN